MIGIVITFFVLAKCILRSIYGGRKSGIMQIWIWRLLALEGKRRRNGEKPKNEGGISVEKVF